jgi:hypothetical protein
MNKLWLYVKTFISSIVPKMSMLCFSHEPERHKMKAKRIKIEFIMHECCNMIEKDTRIVSSKNT